MFKVQLDVIGGDTLLVTASRELPGGIKTAVKQTGVVLAGYMGEEAPVDRGRLTGSMASRMVGAYEARVSAGGSNVAYAAAVARGTKPHEIRPKKAKALAFAPVAGKNSEGQNMYRSTKTGKLVKSKKRGTIFAKVVKHPGTKPNPYDERAMIRTLRDVPSVVNNALRAAGVLE